MTQRDVPDRSMVDPVFRGLYEAAEAAESAAVEVLRTFGEDCPLEYPDTTCSCPVLRVLTGTELHRAGDLSACIQKLRTMPGEPGQTALLYEEIGILLRHLLRKGEETGCVSDAVIRMLGVPLITGDMPGVAVIMGRAKCAAHVSVLAQQYREKGLGVFLAGAAAAQARSEGLSPDKDSCIIFLGAEETDYIHAISALARIAEVFCGVSSGDVGMLQQSLRERIPAFINVFGVPDGRTTAVLTAAAALGIPALIDAESTDIQCAGTIFTAVQPEKMAAVSLEKRGIKVRPKAVFLPSGYDSAFEGEHVRDPDCAIEFGPACELVRMAPSAEVEDHRITLVGGDLPEPEADGYAVMTLAVAAEVSGKRMQPGFEPVIERRIHTWLSYAAGVQHSGSRSRVRLRISRDSLKKGLHLKDLAEVIYTGIRTEFEPVVDRCQVTLITQPAAAERFLKDIALPRYQERDARLAALTDESVDRFYSCTMCQSIAPRHCCVVTPERGGMCGAVTWPDAAATYELSDSGPNRPISKGSPRDERLGAYDSVDHAVAEATAGAVKQISLYSLIDNPMTCCGRLECICAMEPVSRGVVVIDRDYSGMTPIGMPFEELAATVFGGEQTPGMTGVSRRHISSRKFLRADGGALRIVWMPKALKEDISEPLNETVLELYGIEDFCGMICDETIAHDPDALYAFLTEKEHPVLKMGPML